MVPNILIGWIKRVYPIGIVDNEDIDRTMIARIITLSPFQTFNNHLESMMAG